jgi:tetratricopeptide (TPR) repeat protein
MAGGAFRKERSAAARAVESLPEFGAWYWERDAHAGPYSSRDLCIKTARTSDGLVLVLGDELTPITRDEFVAAYGAGVPCFIFLDERCTRNAEANAFVQREWKRAVTQPFGTLKELEQRVRLALIEFARNNWRYQLLEHRARRAEAVRRERLNAAEGEVLASKGYEAIDLEMVGEDGSSRSASDIVDGARRDAKKGLHRRVYDELWGLAESAREAGLAQAALDLLGEMQSLLGDQLDAEQQAWIANSEGICLGRLGRDPEAEARYLEMKEIGENIADDDIVATALQNLAASAFSTGNLERAAEFARASLPLKLKIEDYFGATQVIGNMAAIAIESRDLPLADELLSFVFEVAHAFGEPGLLSSLEGNLGNACVKRGEFDEARRHFRKALELARRSGDLGRECNAMISVGRVETDIGRPTEALRWHKKGIALADSIGDLQHLHQHAIGAALSSMRTGRDDAGAYFDLARNAAASIGDLAAWAGATADLAATTIESDPGRSEALLGEAFAAFDELGDREWQTRILRNWAALDRRHQNPAAAIKKLAEGLALLPNDAHDERAEVLAHMAEAALAAGDHEGAAELVGQQLGEQRAGGLRGAELSWQIASAAAGLSGGGAEEAALPLWREAIKRYQRGGDRALVFGVRNDYANSLVELGRTSQALREMDKCRELAAELASPALALQTEMNRAEALRRASQFAESIHVAEKALAAVPDRNARKEDSELRELEVKTFTNLALTLSEAARLPEAETTLERALGIAREFHRAELEAEVLGGLGHLACLEKRFAKAARLFERAARKRDASRATHIEDLGSIVWAWSAAGGAANIDEHVQRLVDAAQAQGEELEAADRLSDAARLWLPREVVVAADLYAIATFLAFIYGQRRGEAEAARAGGVEPADDGSQRKEMSENEADLEARDPTSAAIARIIATAAIHSNVESPATSRALKRELPRALSRQRRGAGKHLKPFVDAVWESAVQAMRDDG